MWSFGGAETDPSGKKVVLNSKQTIEAVKWMVAFWKEACDEGALAWDDTNNNRAFHANEISATLNGASIYIFAKRNPEKVKNEAGQPMWNDIAHFGIPAGPNGPTPPYFVPFSHGLMKYSKNQKVAKDFIRYYMDRPQYDRYFEVMDTFGIPGTQAYRDNPLWAKDPKTAVFPETLQYARQVGFAEPPGRKATEALSKFILVDMFAKSIQGMPPEDAVKWADGELKRIYGT